MIGTIPLAASFLNPAAVPKRRRSLYANIFDRLGQGGDQNLTDDQKEGLTRQGLLNLGIGMLQTKGQGFGGALGAGLQSGLLSVNQGVEDIGNQRYKDEIIARTRQGMERNTAIEKAMSGVLNPDGTINQEQWGALAQVAPDEALEIREKATPKPQNDWTLGQIGDGEGGTLDVWVNKDTRELRDLTGNPIGGEGFLSGATVADGPQQPTTGLLGSDVLPQLEQAVMQVESGGNPNAVSPKGAMGTMQTMPGTLVVPSPFKPYTNEHLVLNRDDKSEIIPSPPMDLYVGEIEDMADAILEGQPPLVTPEDSIANVRALTALYRSAREGKPITL